MQQKGYLVTQETKNPIKGAQESLQHVVSTAWPHRQLVVPSCEVEQTLAAQ